VSGLRSTEQRRLDVLAALEGNRDLWLATADASGHPHLIAVSSWWDGTHVVIATTGGSRTASNLNATGLGRLALGSPDDVTMVDVTLLDSVAVDDADPQLAAGFVAAAGWDPREEGSDWRFFRLQPVRMQAYRGYGEMSGRDVMRSSRWLT
jgi:Pyridoxamine 5'-phosphate oxidase